MIHCPTYYKGAFDINKKSNLPYADGTSLKFSPTGKYLISSYYFSSKFCVYEFDCENGELHFKTIQNSPSLWSVAFSPNEKFIYLSSHTVVQYDLIKKTFFDFIMDYDNNIGNSQLGIDGKIYIAMEGQKYLGVIEEPNLYGNDSKYIKDGLKLKYGTCQQGLPNFNQSYFYTPSIDFAYKEDCIDHIYAFEAEILLLPIATLGNLPKAIKKHWFMAKI